MAISNAAPDVHKSVAKLFQMGRALRLCAPQNWCQHCQSRCCQMLSFVHHSVSSGVRWMKSGRRLRISTSRCGWCTASPGNVPAEEYMAGWVGYSWNCWTSGPRRLPGYSARAFSSRLDVAPMLETRLQRPVRISSGSKLLSNAHGGRHRWSIGLNLMAPPPGATRTGTICRA